MKNIKVKRTDREPLEINDIMYIVYGAFVIALAIFFIVLCFLAPINKQVTATVMWTDNYDSNTKLVHARAEDGNEYDFLANGCEQFDIVHLVFNGQGEVIDIK